MKISYALLKYRNYLIMKSIYIYNNIRNKREYKWEIIWSEFGRNLNKDNEDCI